MFIVNQPQQCRGELCSPEFRAAITKRAAAALNTPVPDLTISDCLEFTRTGNRVNFEAKYFARRHQLNDLVMAEYITGSSEYLEQIINIVWKINEESGWQLPAHNTYIRDTVQNPLPDPFRPVLDLFACETAASIALTNHLLGGEMEKIAPGIQKRILSELEHRIIQPYLTTHFWWMGNGPEQMCNWTPWCTKNILIVTALTPQTDETQQTIHKKAGYSLECFLKGYGEDGCCDEGAKYYGHAALCLYTAMELLGSDFSSNKIRNIADYIRQVHVSGDYYINFADCPPILEPPGVLAFLFGKRTNNPDLQAFAAEGIKRRGLHTPSNDLSLYTRLLTLFSINEITQFKHTPKPPRDKYFDSVGMLVARDERTNLAVKAGGNGDNHNHNDTGSVTLYFDGKPFLIDVGVGSYTRETFSDKRYTIWTMQSVYHNLPTFNGIMQGHGAEYRAKDVRYDIGSEETWISMDIAGAYPPEASVSRYKRTVRLAKGTGVYISDEYEGRYPAELSLMFSELPAINAGTANIRVDEITIDDPVLLNVWQNKLYRVVVTFTDRITVFLSVECGGWSVELKSENVHTPRHCGLVPQSAV